MHQLSLKYNDERDKAAGMAGMAITIVAVNAAHLIDGIDIDAVDGSNMQMSDDITISGNPRVSAKAVWEQSVKDLRAVLSMVLGNMACPRRMGTSKDIKLPDTDFRKIVREQSASWCGLDPDEADALYDDCSAFVRRLFSHTSLPSIAEKVIQRIIERRRMTADEVIELLSSLGVG